MPVSVAIITKNEENRLPECLRSVFFADEIIVVDACSTDNTVEIAQSFGAKVFIEQWQGFSAQKQRAVDHCTNRWVLILDADERVPQDTASLIKEISDESPRAVLPQSYANASAYSLKRKNYLHGRWIKSCGWWPNRVIRLIDKARGAFDGQSIHESWISNGSTIHLDVSIDHLSFKNYSDLIKKMDHYSDLGANVLYDRVTNPSSFKAVIRGGWMFFKTYFLERGFLNGFDGFVISITNAGGSFFKYAKHRELAKYLKNRAIPK